MLQDVDGEAERLPVLDDLAPTGERLAGLRQVPGRRIRLAEALAGRLARPGGAAEYSPGIV